MSSLLTSSDRIEAWRSQIQLLSADTESSRGRSLKRAFDMEDHPHPDLPYREPSTRSLSPRKRQRHDNPTPPKTTVSQPSLTLSDTQSFAAPSVTSRSDSPTRQIKRADLRFTKPSFTLGSGGNEWAHITTPDHIRDLVRLFGEEACTAGCIPASIFDEVRAISQDMDEVPTRSRGDEDGQDHSALLDTVKSLYADADENYANNHDENAWYSLVSEVLRYGSKKTSPLTIVSAQTKSTFQDLLPQNPFNENNPIGNVKVDFLLHFNYAGNNEIRDALKPCLYKNDGVLSAFNDRTIKTAFSLSVVEVKPAGGDHTDALYQLTVASAAMQQRLVQVRARGSKTSIEHDYHQTLPVVCLAVIGHLWYLHIVYRASPDYIVSHANKVLFFADINLEF